MRYFPMILAESLSASDHLVRVPAQRAPIPTLPFDRSAVADAQVKKGCLLPPIRPATLSP